MSDSERYQEYIKEHCMNCKNKDTNLCEIRIIHENKNTTTTNYDNSYLFWRKG